jgi:hypothetical protein
VENSIDRVCDLKLLLRLTDIHVSTPIHTPQRLQTLQHAIVLISITYIYFFTMVRQSLEQLILTCASRASAMFISQVRSNSYCCAPCACLIKHKHQTAKTHPGHQ